MGVFAFSNDGRLNVSWPDGTASTYDFQLGEEALGTAPGEFGRTLIWAYDLGHSGDSDYYVMAVLMVYQSSTECFLLFSDDVGPNGPEHSLSTVVENLYVDGDPVFDFWSKCYKQ